MTRTIRLIPMIGTVPVVEVKATLSMLDSGGNRCRRGGIRGLTLRFEGSTQKQGWGPEIQSLRRLIVLLFK